MKVLSSVSVAHEDAGQGPGLRPEEVHVLYEHLTADAAHDLLSGGIEVRSAVHGEIKGLAVA